MPTSDDGESDSCELNATSDKSRLKPKEHWHKYYLESASIDMEYEPRKADNKWRYTELLPGILETDDMGVQKKCKGSAVDDVMDVDACVKGHT